MTSLETSLMVYGTFSTLVSTILGYKYWNSGQARISTKIDIEKVLLKNGFTQRLIVRGRITAHNKATTIMRYRLRHYARKKDSSPIFELDGKKEQIELEAGRVISVELYRDDIFNNIPYEKFCKGWTVFEVEDSLHEKPFVVKVTPPYIPESEEQRQLRQENKRKRDEMMKKRYGVSSVQEAESEEKNDKELKEGFDKETNKKTNP